MEKLFFLFFDQKTDRKSNKIQRSGLARDLVLAVACWLAVSVAHGQQSSVLDGYIQIGLDSNSQLAYAQLDIDKGLAQLAQAKALFRPQVDFQASYTLSQGGRTINLPIGDLLNPVYTTLNQMTGTDQFPQLDNMSEQFLPHHFHETKFRVVQPLFNTDIYYSYKAKAELVSVQQAKRQVYAQTLIKDIKLAYFQLLQAHLAIGIYQDTQLLLEEALRVNRSLVANGKATNEGVYGTEYERSRIGQALQEAQGQFQVAQAYFNFLLNRPLDATVEIDEALLAATMAPPALDTAEHQAVQGRKEFKQLQAAMNAQAQAIELHKARALPSVALVGDLGYQGFGYKFDSTQDFWMVQLSLKWNVFNGGRRQAGLQQAKVEEEQLRNQYAQLQQQIKLQVRQAYYQFQTASAAIQTAQAGLESAKRQYELTKRKHEEGQLPAFQLLDAQTKYTTARLSLSIAQAALLMKQTQLQSAIGSLGMMKK